MKLTKSQPWPFDYDALQKGDTIEVGVLEQVSGVSRTDRGYPLAVLQLRERIMKELRKRGRPVTVKADGDNLVVLTDADASIYNASEFDADVRAMRRAHRRSLDVDMGSLPASDQGAHLRRLQVQAMQLVAIGSARREAKRIGEPDEQRLTSPNTGIDA